MKQSAAYLEAAGLAPPATATADERDRYQERVKNTARTILTLRQIYGFTAPAAPESGDLAPKAGDAFRKEGLASVSDEFHALVGKVGFEDALTIFLSKHPDYAPWTVSTTKSTSGAYIPATKDAVKFIEANGPLFRKFPTIAAFMLPQKAEGGFDQSAWRTEMANGLRTRTSFEEHYRNLKISGLLGTYYDSRKRHEDKQVELKLKGDLALAKTERDAYSAWRKDFLARNPLIADYLAEGAKRDLDRRRVVDQLRAALSNNAVPEGPMRTSFASLLQAYDAHMAFQQAHAGRDDQSTNLRQTESKTYEDYIAKIADSDPNAHGLWNKVFRYLDVSS
jgi:hypothetical protein